MGIHRLVRISPYDSNAKRHTSFASVFVFPELPDELDIEILDKDLKVDTFRASGAGGQHINKTDSAIRITHLPSGIVVSCQSQRSQHKNRATALKQLKSRLFEMEQRRKAEEAEVLSGEKKEIGWGVRSAPTFSIHTGWSKTTEPVTKLAIRMRYSMVI